MRQVLNGNVGPLHNLSEILTDIVICFIDKSDPNTIKSTEKFLAAFTKYNANNEHSNEQGKKLEYDQNQLKPPESVSYPMFRFGSGINKNRKNQF